MTEAIKPCPFCGHIGPYTSAAQRLAAQPACMGDDCAELASLKDSYAQLLAENTKLRAAQPAQEPTAIRPQTETCGASAIGGLYVLPVGHNRGRADVTANHQAAPATVPPGFAQLPKDVEEAKAMMRVSSNWLQDNAPELLRAAQPAQEPIGYVHFGAVERLKRGESATIVPLVDAHLDGDPGDDVPVYAAAPPEAWLAAHGNKGG